MEFADNLESNNRIPDIEIRAFIFLRSVSIVEISGSCDGIVACESSFVLILIHRTLEAIVSILTDDLGYES